MIRWITKHAASLVVLATLLAVAGGYTAVASPFGQGVFSADVPFGAGTSMSIALAGTVNLMATDQGGGIFSGSGAHTVTVTSTDVVGYRLYLYAPTSTTLTNGSETIAASANTNLEPLATDTWGYNISGSTTNFVGMTNRPVVLHDSVGPHKNGEATTVTYGIKVNATKGAGDYSGSIVYTAVGKSE